ncbi:hypothetical protein Tco_1407824 [Tanacetum coccineum]
MSPSPQHTPTSAPSTSKPPHTQPTSVVEESVPTPHESPLQSVHSFGCDEGNLSINELTVLCTSLSNKVTGLESELQQTKQIYSTALTKLILRGRKISDIDEDPNISLVQDKGMTWFQDADAEIQEKASDETELVLSRYHALKIRPRSIAQVRKNMCIYLKNQEGYKMKDFKGMSYDDIRPLFEKVWDYIYSFVPMDSELEVQRSKRKGQNVEAEPSKRQRTGEVLESVQEHIDEESKIEELSQEQLHQLIITVPEEGIHVEALQTKYPIVDWEIHSEDTIKFWKIIRVGDHTMVYQTFVDMLKNFDREDLLKLWSLVQERFNSSRLADDKEKELWVELKMMFEPDEETLEMVVI